MMRWKLGSSHWFTYRFDGWEKAVAKSDAKAKSDEAKKNIDAATTNAEVDQLSQLEQLKSIQSIRSQ